MWSVFFLIPVGRGVQEQRIEAEEYEVVFAQLWRESQRRPFAIKTTEAPHYRRFVLHQTQAAAPDGTTPTNWLGSARHRAPLGVGDGKGIMFVSHRGEIYPAGFLPLQCAVASRRIRWSMSTNSTQPSSHCATLTDSKEPVASVNTAISAAEAARVPLLSPATPSKQNPTVCTSRVKFRPS